MKADGAEPGTVRPGGRTARVRAAVLCAAGDLLADRGYDGLDLGEVARRAGVGKTTVYRRWGSAPALVTELLTDMTGGLPRPARTESLAGGLRAPPDLLRRVLTDPRTGALLKGVIAASAHDRRSARALRRFDEALTDRWTPCVTRAVERGELPAGTDPGEVVRAVCAPLYHRMLMGAGPLDTAFAVHAAHTVATAARAGAFAPPPADGAGPAG